MALVENWWDEAGQSGRMSDKPGGTRGSGKAKAKTNAKALQTNRRPKLDAWSESGPV